MDAVTREPVAPNGERGPVLCLTSRGADHDGGEVVDEPAREHLDRLSVHRQLPAREMAYVLDEEALSLVDVHVPRNVGVEERPPVEDDQRLGHRTIFPAVRRGGTPLR